MFDTIGCRFTLSTKHEEEDLFMFDIESHVEDISVECEVHPSFSRWKSLGFAWLKFDVLSVDVDNSLCIDMEPHNKFTHSEPIPSDSVTEPTNLNDVVVDDVVVMSMTWFWFYMTGFWFS